MPCIGVISVFRGHSKLYPSGPILFTQANQWVNATVINRAAGIGVSIEILVAVHSQHLSQKTVI
jgi:hypothetical protein